MPINIIFFFILITGFLMVASKRVTALINGFLTQAILLFGLIFYLAVKTGHTELYVVAVLLFLIKVVFVPVVLHRMVRKIKVSEDLGLFLSPTLSILIALFLVYLAYLFTDKFIPIQSDIESSAFAVSLSVILIGIFIMIFRLKALAQVLGLLVMENGVFLAASGISGGMPFFVEIAVFFDIFLVVMILGVFVYKINSVFTHIDIDKLTNLKG